MMATKSDGKASGETPLLVLCQISLSETRSSNGDERISLLPFSDLVILWVLKAVFILSLLKGKQV